MAKQSVYGMRAQTKQAEPRSGPKGVWSTLKGVAAGATVGTVGGVGNILTADIWAPKFTEALGIAASTVGASPPTQQAVTAVGVGVIAGIGAMVGYDMSRSKTAEQAGRRADLRHGIGSKQQRARARGGQSGPDRGTRQVAGRGRREQPNRAESATGLTSRQGR
ncbi:MAG: hypothetical protein GEV07_06065 [Streptosporangiales bacterium]|nr:hypothetical protein [Streptosporangiales bacterium]